LRKTIASAVFFVVLAIGISLAAYWWYSYWQVDWGKRREWFLAVVLWVLVGLAIVGVVASIAGFLANLIEKEPG
jgi:hypothetical protein